ncbi:hypothetical protein CFOL_v3_17187 [Cephalotus follicularis]|uniref:Gag-asp_proteas domain-containing protein n=1 Tax=Cephalotus follicularis TaxID=3775 RepID=A0A1Q3C0B2_CEPFO|nr:hypothetical protein CFOL_v3_17187 [Cephalotus follicularis]
MSTSFSNEDLGRIKTPHVDPLVVIVQIVNHSVNRVLVDNGSSTDVLSFDAFKLINLSLNDLKMIQSPLVGLIVDTMNLVGVISLSMAIGEETCQVTIFVSFLVIKMPSTYNVILGHPSLARIKAVVLIPHLKMKFPTP